MSGYQNWKIGLGSSEESNPAQREWIEVGWALLAAAITFGTECVWQALWH